jgi:hypothetical protein
MDLSLTVASWALEAAVHAGFGESEPQVLCNSEISFLEANMDLTVVIGPANGTFGLEPEGTSAASEHLGKDVGRKATWETSTTHLRPVSVPKLIKVLAFLGI